MKPAGPSEVYKTVDGIRFHAQIRRLRPSKEATRDAELTVKLHLPFASKSFRSNNVAFNLKLKWSYNGCLN